MYIAWCHVSFATLLFGWHSFPFLCLSVSVSLTRALSSLSRRPDENSSIDEVAAWLVSLGFTQHIGVFFKAKFDGKKLLAANEKQLTKMMKSGDDVVMLMRALATSRVQGSSHFSDDA